MAFMHYSQISTNYRINSIILHSNNLPPFHVSTQNREYAAIAVSSRFEIKKKKRKITADNGKTFTSIARRISPHVLPRKEMGGREGREGRSLGSVLPAQKPGGHLKTK